MDPKLESKQVLFCGTRALNHYPEKLCKPPLFLLFQIQDWIYSLQHCQLSESLGRNGPVYWSLITHALKHVRLIQFIALPWTKRSAFLVKESPQQLVWLGILGASFFIIIIKVWLIYNIVPFSAVLSLPFNHTQLWSHYPSGLFLTVYSSEYSQLDMFILTYHLFQDFLLASSVPW